MGSLPPHTPASSAGLSGRRSIGLASMATTYSPPVRDVPPPSPSTPLRVTKTRPYVSSLAASCHARLRSQIVPATDADGRIFFVRLRLVPGLLVTA